MTDRPEAHGVRIRPATPLDETFIVAAAERLSAFGPPSWRKPADVVEGEVRTLRRFLESPTSDAALLVAEDERGPAGFAYLETLQDYFTRESHAHLGILAVAAHAEGRGIGRALIAAAEAWARDRGSGWLTLNVFHANRRAREVYEHLGFEPEAVKYVKQLGR
jgi:GNAT superfamily N-acetyltransferase